MPSNEHSLTTPDDTVADDPAADDTVADDTATDDPSESFWLKEAKAALRARDPVDAANDAGALARWADLHCGDILQTGLVAIQGNQDG